MITILLSWIFCFCSDVILSFLDKKQQQQQQQASVIAEALYLDLKY